MKTLKDFKKTIEQELYDYLINNAIESCKQSNTHLTMSRADWYHYIEDNYYVVVDNGYHLYPII
jgi:hypothetical protein